jgi:hypothetical protein
MTGFGFFEKYWERKNYIKIVAPKLTFQNIFTPKIKKLCEIDLKK